MSAAPEVIAAAQAYMARGHSIVAVRSDKRPWGDEGDGKNWRRQFSKDEILDRLNGGRCVAIGFLGGTFNHNVVPLDFDTVEGEAWWRSKCEAAGIDPDDFPTVITPGKIKKDGTRTPGKHRYVTDTRGTLGNVEGNLKRLGINVRGRGHAVLPPSPHPDGGTYRWFERHSFDDFSTIPRCPDFAYEAIEAKSHKVEKQTTALTPDESARRYCRAALEKEIDALARTACDRNNALNNAALKLGSLQHFGAFSEFEVMTGLRDACEQNALIGDDGLRAFKATAASGWNAGLESPRTIEQRDEKRRANGADGPHHASADERHPEENEGDANLGEWDAGDDSDSIPPRGWLEGNVFCRGFVSSLLAAGGTGKTAVRHAQLLSLVIGLPLTGEHIFQRCRVGIVSLEDDANELRLRILAARIHHAITKAELKGWLFLVALGAKGGKLLVMDNGVPTRSALADKIEAFIVRRKLDVVSLDPFVKTHSVPENDNSAIDDVVQILSDIAVKYDCAVDVPHHTSKGTAEAGNADRGRGASAAKDAMRLVYTLAPMTPDEAKTFGISEEQRRLLVRMDSAKVNVAPPLLAAKWFRLVGVPLGNATEMYPHGDEVQTVEPWTPPDTWAGISNFVANQILTDIDAGLPDGERYSNAPRANDRAAWRVVAKHVAGKEEGPAREIVSKWLKTGTLIEHDYDSSTQRKKRKGLKVDPAKRPS